MAETFTPVTTSNLTNQTSITAAIDENFATVATLLEDVLSREGNTPNQMLSSLDMNSNQVINLPSPATGTSPVRINDIEGLVLGNSNTTTVTDAAVVINANTVDSCTTVTNGNVIQSTVSTVTNSNATINNATNVTSATSIGSASTVSSSTSVGTASTVNTATTVNTAQTVSSATNVLSTSTVTSATNVFQSFSYDSRTTAALTNIPSLVTLIYTGGYSSRGDGGGAKYFKTTGSTTGGFQSLDGAWWALNELVVNPLMFGAVNTFMSGFDSAPAIQNAVNFAQNSGSLGATVFIPSGHYYINSSITVVESGIGAVIKGAGRNNTFIYALSDINMFEIECAVEMSDMFLSGWNSVSSSSIVVNVHTTGANSTFKDLTINYGGFGFQTNGGNTKLLHVGIAYCPNSLAHLLNTTNCIDCDFDTDYPVGQPGYGVTINSWSAATPYSVGTIVKIHSGNYYIQCLSGGTSGGTEPVAVGFAPLNITDGTVTWRLALTSSSTGVHIDSSSVSTALQCEFTNCDFSVASQWCMQVDAASGGSSAPNILNIIEGSFAGGLQGCLNIASGSWVMINSTQFSGSTNTGSIGVNFGSAFAGRSSIIGCSFFGNSSVSLEAGIGIEISSGSNYTISGNYIGQMGIAGIQIGNGINNFNIANNMIVSCPTGIQVGSSCDFFNIVNNLYNTCTTGLSNGSSGAANTTTSPNH